MDDQFQGQIFKEWSWMQILKKGYRKLKSGERMVESGYKSQ